MTTEEKDKTTNTENSKKTEKGIACDIRPGIWRLLSDHLYKDRTVVYRELISNACDAINKKIAQLTQEFKDGRISREALDRYEKKIKIYINEGINDLAIQDNGIGLDNFDEFQAIGKTKYKDNNNKDSKNIGLFGVGKLTGLRASNCETVVYESIVKTKRGGQIGILVTLQPDDDDVLRYLSEPIDSSDIRKTTTIIETGTRVTIKDAQTKDLDVIRKYISETFAVKIAEQFQISTISAYTKYYLNNELETSEVEDRIPFPEGFDPQGQVLFSLSDGTLVVGVLKKSNKRGVIRGSYKGVFIQELDPNYKIEDWSWIDIVSEKVRVTVGRDSFVIDNSTIYEEFQDKLKTYLDENGFEKADTVLVSEKQKSALKKAQVEQILLYKRFFPNDTLPEPLAKLGGPNPEGGGVLKPTGPLTDKKKPGEPIHREPLDPDRIIIKRGPYIHHEHHGLEESGGGEGPETDWSYIWLDTGKANYGYYWDPVEKAFIINLGRPSWRLLYKKKLEKAAIHEVVRATVRMCPENTDLDTFEKKYQELIDGNIDRTWTP